ncbi:MAG: TRAP transporter small permease [Betaproteobacteria bacterium]|nr:MAG: TRAP transporter small permease [Betaproteobacteria bacterium]
MSSSSNAGVATTVVDGYFKFLKFLIAFCLLAMVILVFGNVFLRYAFNSGITLSEELSRWFFVWMTFIGALIGLREHSHLGVDSFVNRLTPRGRRVCLALAQTLMIYCSWLLLSGSWDQTIINLEVEAPSSGLSLAFVYGIGVFFAANAILILVFDLYRVVSGKLSDAELVMVKESEESVHGDPQDTAAATKH